MLGNSAASAGINARTPWPSGPPRSTRSRGVYIALALFLGGLGVHNFYAGYVWRGFAQVGLSFLIGVFSVLDAGLLYFFFAMALWAWIILDMIMIDEDAHGASM